MKGTRYHPPGFRGTFTRENGKVIPLHYQDAWGNLGLHVARRDDPHTTGVVVADLGYGGEFIATTENDAPKWYPHAAWVGVGSPWHDDMLAGRDPRGQVRSPRDHVHTGTDTTDPIG